MKYAPIHTLQTSRLVLRKLEQSDVPAFYERLGGNSKVTEHMLWAPHKDISESEASIQKVLRRYESGTCYRWGITLRENGELIGIIDLLAFDEEKSGCSFAYMLGEDFWGRGYGTEAVKAVFSFAFDALEIAVIEADHFAENPASGAVMRKAGMSFTGTLPQKYEKNGQYHDAHVYRITAQEWRSHED